MERNVSGDKEIAQFRLGWMARNAKGAKLIVWSQNLPAYAKGHYHDEDPYCDAAVVLVAPQHKNRLLEHCRFGGTGTLFSLTSCPKEIHQNLVPWKQHLCQSWCLQCTFMTDLIDGLYKKTPEHGQVTFRSFTIEPMSADQELQDLLREFGQTGLQNIVHPPSAPAAREETLPAPPLPMQTQSARKQFKPEVRSKKNEDQH